MFQYTIVRTPEEEWVTVYAPGRDPLPASSSHPNFDRIVSACVGQNMSADDVADLFDVAATVERQFQRLSERVTVSAGGVFLDGDPVHGTLQTQILDFLDAGEDFGPLVNFYEKLTTNPLGDVRDGLYDWIRGQTENGGKLTITQGGNILGYKSMQSTAPEWRTDQERVWRPSRRGEGIVNGLDVGAGQYIEQVPGDVVEMPRSRVLHAPSQACGDGLHIGTYEYARTFSRGDTVMLVEFSPRDIVSLPDRNSTWKLRVCRYTVIGPVDSPLDVPVFITAPVEPDEDPQDDLDLTFESDEDEPDFEADFEAGDRAKDWAGDLVTILEVEPVADDGDQRIRVRWDNADYAQNVWLWASCGFTKVEAPLAPGDRVEDAEGDQGTIDAVNGDGTVDFTYDDTRFGIAGKMRDIDPSGCNLDDGTGGLTRLHGRGGPTSQAAKGRGRNPAQDEKGRFSAGRPGSHRDASTGRFV